MLTTTVDGLWALQILSGIETLAPELGLRPVLPRAETRETALVHPITKELQAAGAVDASGQVDAAIVEWLTVLARRDVSLVMYVNTPVDDGIVGVLLARFAQWWVVIERTQDLIRIGPAGTASAEGAATAVIRTQVERLCGPLPAAAMRPVTLDVGDIVERVKSPESLRAFLGSQQVDPEQMRLLMLAVDPQQSASASIVASQAGANPGSADRTHIEPGAVTIYDTPEGRLLAEHTPQGGKQWMIVGPGTPAAISAAVSAMLRRLPAGPEWFSYRKIV